MKNEMDLGICLSSTIIDADLLGSYDKSDPVFHYTSPDGLLGILRETGPTLWFSQYDSLNDTTEGVHILEVYQDVCEELLANGKIDSVFYQAVHDVEPMKTELFLYSWECLKTDKRRLGIIHDGTFEEAQKYICCFSKNRDSLPMWNYYTKGDKYEGYNIGFCLWRTKQMGIQDCYGKGYNLDFFTVIYDDTEKKKIMRDKIEELYPFYKDGIGENTLARIKSILSYYLKALALKFKQDCFQHEQEVRAILTVPKGNTEFTVKYRSKAGYIIPYVEVSFPPQIISGITVGPLLNDQTALKNIQQFSRNRHYLLNDQDIQTSKIPVRY